MKLYRSALVLCFLALGVPAALGAQWVSVTPLPAGTTIQRLGEQSFHAGECGTIYLNDVLYGAGYYYGAGAGVEVADDLHMISGGSLCAVEFVYYKASSEPTDATLTIYANTPVDDPPGPALSGPWLVPALPGAGAYGVHVELPAAAVPADVWLGVAFNTSSTGLIIMSPPTVGASDDLFYQTPPGDVYYFGGDPPANFGMAVYAAIATPTRGSSWGAIKQLYR